MLRKVLAATAALLLLTRGGVSQCYSELSCGGDVIPSNDQRDCCVYQNGLSYNDVGTCRPCIVHGFRQSVYDTGEDARLDTDFAFNVVGMTQLPTLVLSGTITAEADGTASSSDFEGLQPINVLSNPSSPPTNVRLFTANDELTLEYEDRVLLRFTPSSSDFISFVADRFEYIRDTAIVNIIDNDPLEINFEESDLTIEEGSGTLSSPITLQFRLNQNPFNVTLSPVTVDDAESKQLGFFINSGNIGQTFRATAGVDFSDMPITIEIPANSREYVVEEFIVIYDDNIDEDEQSFAIVAEIGHDVPDGISCFQIATGQANCSAERLGATQIRIDDNDPMIIGFTNRYIKVSESMVPEGDDFVTIFIELATLRTAERQHRMQYRIQEANATVVSHAKNENPDFDARFGNREELDEPIIVEDFLNPTQDEVMSLSSDIRNDFKPEDKEYFTIRIFPLDIAGRRELFQCNETDSEDGNYFCETTIWIWDDDEPFRVAFVEKTYTVDESVGAVNVCVNLTRPMINILDETVNVFVIDNPSSIYIPPGAPLATPDEPNTLNLHDMIEGTDFAQRTTTINIIDTIVFTQEMRLICYNQLIYEDLLVEADEYAGLTLSVQNNVMTTVKAEVEPMYDQVSILIVDNDRAVVGLEETFYIVGEGDGTVEVCAIVQMPATGSCPMHFPFTVYLSTEDDSAESLMDYIVANKTIIEFDACQRKACVNITIVDDKVLEMVESFSLTLERNGLSDRIDLDPIDGTVEIIDNDRAVVGLEKTFYNVTEGDGTVQVCAIVQIPPDIDCPISFPFTVLLSTMDMLAVDAMDYDAAIRTMVRFPACERRVCVDISIVDDGVLENLEDFGIILDRNGLDNRIDLIPDSGIVEITDNDRAVVGLERTFYSVGEGDGRVQVCVVVHMPDTSVSCPIGFPFTVLLSTEDDSAESPMDYAAALRAMGNFAACQRESCIDITIVDDNVLEGNESFTLTLDRNGLDIRIDLDPGDGTVEITDNEVAQVGLEHTFYEVSEDVGVVEVCAVVYMPDPSGPCPIDFDFTVLLSTVAMSAGSPSDYVGQQNEPLSFAACTNRSSPCVTIPIADDNTAENVERFGLSLRRNGLDNRITLDPENGIVQINDNEVDPPDLVNDTVTGDPLMTVPIYTTPENTLCYEVHGETDQTFNLISDNCVAVNAHYTRAVVNNPNITLNVIDSIGVRAVATDDTCVNISVNLEGCVAMVNDQPGTVPYQRNGISVRKYNNRVRIVVPNCGETDLVMWVFCTSGNTADPKTNIYYNFDFLRFVVRRGLNLNERSHGLIGQFWNIKIDVQEHSGLFNGNIRSDDYNITVRHPGSSPRSFMAIQSSVTWEFEKKPCLYVGNSQAGPLGEDVDPNDSVIEGAYKDYMVESIYSPDFKFAHIDENNCMTK